MDDSEDEWELAVEQPRWAGVPPDHPQVKLGRPVFAWKRIWEHLLAFCSLGGRGRAFLIGPGARAVAYPWFRSGLIDLFWRKLVLKTSRTARRYRGEVKYFKGSFGWVTPTHVRGHRFGQRDIYLHKNDCIGSTDVKKGMIVNFRLQVDASGNPKCSAAFLRSAWGAVAFDRNAALMTAAQQGDVEVATVLLGFGASPGAENRCSTALTIAAFGGHTGVIRALLGAGADVDAVNASGDTALIVSARYGHADATAILLEAGADTKVLDGADALTAFEVAKMHDKLDVVAMLREHEAHTLVLTLHLATRPDSDCLDVTCTNLGGEELVAAHVNPERTIAHLRALVRERFPGQPVHLIMPSGRVLGKGDYAMRVASLER